jgi:tetratricopeptide (TPR) repeat protein
MILLAIFSMAASLDGGTSAATLAANHDTSFALANHAMSRGAFSEAAEGYEAIASSGVLDGHVFYNLGNAYLRSSQLGKAIASYRAALRLLPRDEDVRANLAFARKQIKDALAPPEPSPIVRTLFMWHFALSAGELGATAALASLCFWACLALLRLGRGGATVRLGGVVCGVVLVCTAPSWAWRTIAPERVGVVVLPEAQAHAAQDQAAVVRFVLHEGAEARLLSVDGDWVRIQLPDGQQGWIAASAIAVVES